jgi:hypothetical protein
MENSFSRNKRKEGRKHGSDRTCKTRGFHGGYYAERRLLGYKNPVRTSQETYYISAIKPSPLIQCQI